MEEKKTIKMVPKTDGNNKEQKISYDQLKQLCDQMQAEGRKLLQENQQLREAMHQMSLDRSFREIECIFSCLDRKDFFSDEFIKKVTNRLEEIFDPENKEEETAEK